MSWDTPWATRTTPSHRCAPRSRMPLGSVVTMLLQCCSLAKSETCLWKFVKTCEHCEHITQKLDKIGSYLAWQREFHQRRAHKTSPAQSSLLAQCTSELACTSTFSAHSLHCAIASEMAHDLAHDLWHLCFVSPPCSTSCDRATPYVNGAAFAVPVSNSALDHWILEICIVKRRQLSKPNMTKPISLPRGEKHRKTCCNMLQCKININTVQKSGILETAKIPQGQGTSHVMVSTL